MSRILIFTVTAGNGHNSIAKAISEQLVSMGHETKIVDFYKAYDSKFTAFIMNDAYIMSYKYARTVYNLFYKMYFSRSPEKRDTTAPQGSVKKESPKAVKTIVEFRPNFILCTHMNPAIAITNIKRVFNLRIPVATILSDYTVHPFWESAIGVDYMFTPNVDFNEVLIKKGYNPNQLIPLGFPVKPGFYLKYDKIKMREKLGLRNMFTVVIMSGSGKFSGLDAQLKDLFKSTTPVQIVFINGSDVSMRKKIDKSLKRYKTIHHIVNLGFVDDLAEYMAAGDCIVSKSGCTTICEALNIGVPFITTTKLAEQEARNAKYLHKHNACILLNSKNTLSEVVEKLEQNPKMAKIIVENGKKVIIENSTLKISEFILQKCKEFNKVIIKDIIYASEKGILKKIQRGLKKSKKEYKYNKRDNKITKYCKQII